MGKEKPTTKICKHCQSEIPYKAKICPHCRKKQGGVLKWVIISFVIICVIGSASGRKDEVKDVTPKNEAADNNKETNDLKTTSPETETEDVKTCFQVGEVAEFKGIRVSVTGYEESNGNDWGTPEDGNIFVFPEIEITNNSDEEITISSMISFECYVDDYKSDFSSNAFMAISTEDGKQQLDGSVASGKKLKGVLGIEAPADWKVIEIYYKDNVWLGSDFSFEIVK